MTLVFNMKDATSMILALLIVILNLCVYGCYHLTEPRICTMCGGTVLGGTAVSEFCSRSAGRIDGRCCFKSDNKSDSEHIVGLDLSNCSRSRVEDLQEASTAIIMDLSFNPIANISDSLFQGFIDLNTLILPPDIACPGGNISWERVEITDRNRLCEGQKNMCNQTGGLSFECPEFSLCTPYGPGYFECSCTENYYGYKCLREGEFPVLQVFGPLGASTVVIAFLLWVTQRRKAKSL